MIRYAAVQYTSPEADYNIWMGVVKISGQDSPAQVVNKYAITFLRQEGWEPEDILSILDKTYFFWIDPGAAEGLSKLQGSDLIRCSSMNQLNIAIAKLFRVGVHFVYQESWMDEIDIMLEEKPDEINHYLKDCLGKVTKEEQ